jgi:glucose-6-phosphate 1-dehydrogenase
MRIQPNEAIYWKIYTKTPGLSNELQQVELDLTYKNRFGNVALPDAYERLIYDCLRGDHNLFVRNDELVAAWHIFTPILHQLEREKVKPISYQAGSRGPREADHMLEQYGYKRSVNYSWTPRA